MPFGFDSSPASAPSTSPPPTCPASPPAAPVPSIAPASVAAVFAPTAASTYECLFSVSASELEKGEEPCARCCTLPTVCQAQSKGLSYSAVTPSSAAATPIATAADAAAMMGAWMAQVEKRLRAVEGESEEAAPPAKRARV